MFYTSRISLRPWLGKCCDALIWTCKTWGQLEAGLYLVCGDTCRLKTSGPSWPSMRWWHNESWLISFICDPLAALHGRCTSIIATPRSAWLAEEKDHDGKMLHVCWRSCAPGWSSRQRAARWRPDGSREPGLLNAADTKLFWFEMPRWN